MSEALETFLDLDESAADVLRAARILAGLSQRDLAVRVGTTELGVDDAESGLWSISDAYAAEVLRACGLPKDWRGE